MKKIYNRQTGCYKIHVFLNGVYICSTDQHISCKHAVDRIKYVYRNSLKETDKVTARFAKE